MHSSALLDQSDTAVRPRAVIYITLSSCFFDIIDKFASDSVLCSGRELVENNGERKSEGRTQYTTRHGERNKHQREQKTGAVQKVQRRGLQGIKSTISPKTWEWEKQPGPGGAGQPCRPTT